MTPSSEAHRGAATLDSDRASASFGIRRRIVCECDASFDLGEHFADASMGPRGERQVMVLGARDVELVGICVIEQDPDSPLLKKTTTWLAARESCGRRSSISSLAVRNVTCTGLSKRRNSSSATLFNEDRISGAPKRVRISEQAASIPLPIMFIVVFVTGEQA